MQSGKLYQWIINIIMLLFTLFCVMPFWLLFSASLTDDMEIVRSGYAFFPEKISFTAYSYLWNSSTEIFRAYSITIITTVVGTVLGLTLTAMLAYPLSRIEMPFRNTLAFYVFFTMLFNGGLVPTYLMYTNYFDLKNTMLALIIPGLLMNGFFIILMRTFFATSIPKAIIESAYIDGAKEGVIFYRIVLPLSTPVLATVGLFYTIQYWNDWFNGLIYLTDSKYYSLQNLLNRILLDVQFLQTSTQLGSQSAGIAANIPLASMRMAMAAIGVIPLLIAYPFFQKYFVKGLTIGAVKG
ncbi:carbohydrate ABC transporter permease [Paenibacillus macquariensis]|uniref:Aldouronate transport system permease protein n=1 Tax=Paenibacillus macquariensis TaxID=948756 RepID=A0ABY1K9U3_9BACL|nr:carbohydrate ABC transporter permease [Paenibacillus macquariensis]MEC0092411.1 carbohydrate ABC transporter permease [Paenibacillus macquariensis]OAB35380.1 sugar ABC transporter permease [Paenibacillus macquariensis subsp. macquariensis]SIR47696.1 putative aldouronate transport system permease protein [Paenibacillus macquariensis]